MRTRSILVITCFACLPFSVNAAKVFTYSELRISKICHSTQLPKGAYAVPCTKTIKTFCGVPIALSPKDLAKQGLITQATAKTLNPNDRYLLRSTPLGLTAFLQNCQVPKGYKKPDYFISIN